MSVIDDIVGAVRSVTSGAAPLHAPEIRGNEWAYVKECLDTEWVSTAGAYVTRFEKMVCDIVGAKHTIAVSSGTAALHAALLAVGVGPDDEVLTPSLTFAATANSIAHCGAIPHFVDADALTLGIDAKKLEAHLAVHTRRAAGRLINNVTGRRIAAVVCVHIFGHPADLDGLAEVCRRHGVVLIEDATESLGSYYKGRHTGTTGLLSVLSFNGNKIVTTGGGGAILASDDALAADIRHLTTTAKLAHPWEFIHDRVGYNYRMPNLNAALGCGQLERLDSFVARKRALAAAYQAAFAAVAGVGFVLEPAGCASNYWLNAIRLEDDAPDTRDSALQALNDAGLMSRPLWRPLHLLAPYLDAPRADLAVTESLYRRVICLPSSPRLADSAMRK